MNMPYKMPQFSQCFFRNSKEKIKARKSKRSVTGFQNLLFFPLLFLNKGSGHQLPPENREKGT